LLFSTKGWEMCAEIRAMCGPRGKAGASLGRFFLVLLLLFLLPVLIAMGSPPKKAEAGGAIAAVPSITQIDPDSASMDGGCR